MKKYLFPSLVSIGIGTIFAYLLINSYDKAQPITISKNYDTIFYIQIGVYQNKEKMQKELQDFTSYIYNVEDNMFHAYIGITKNKENVKKIQGVFKEKGYDTYVSPKKIKNKEFIKILEQYDELLNKTNDNKTIEVICNQVLTQYEELMKSEH